MCKLNIKTELIESIIKKPQNQNYTEKIANLAFDMIFVEGGTFTMGSNEKEKEKPTHEVILSDFYMGKYEVTNAEFAAFINDYGSDKVKNGDFSGETMIYDSKIENSGSYNWGLNKVNGKWTPVSGKEKHPIIYVTWYGANEYCNWLSKKTGKKYSLPSEAQWEYAAGGGANNRTKWAGTNNESDLGTYAWFTSNSNSVTHEVGTKTKNTLGLYDMSGNVWEWCLDTWHSNYENAPKDGSAWIDNSSTDRVYRGGSWNFGSSDCRVSDRLIWYADYRFSDLGFRLVVSQSL